LLSVLALVGTLGVAIPTFNEVAQQARRSAVESDLATILSATSTYVLQNSGYLPTDVSGIVPILGPGFLQDVSQYRFVVGDADFIYYDPPLLPNGRRASDGLLAHIADPANTILYFGKLRDDEFYVVGFASGLPQAYTSRSQLPGPLQLVALSALTAPSCLALAASSTRGLADLLQTLQPGQDVVPFLAAYLRNPDTLRTVFNALDADGDGQLTVVELVNFNPGATAPEVSPLLARFLDRVRADLLPGAQAGVSGGLSFDEFATATDGGLFSFNAARSLTTEFVTRAGVARSLTAKLDAAEAAGARGHQKVKAHLLRVYLHELGTQIDATVTADQAATLAFILRGL
jgi:hypothetical protein